MNFTVLNRNSAVGPIYTDRPSLRESAMGESWRKQSNEHHLNPSKSKVNVRSFLNRTGEGFSLSHPNIDNVRASGFLANPPRPSPHASKENLYDSKNSKMNKQNHEMSFEFTSKDSFPTFNFTPVSTSGQEDRKKSDSHLRMSARQGITPRTEEENQRSNDQKAIQQLRSQILSLTKKVFLNEEQITKMKEKEKKDKKLQSLEQQFTQFQKQMFDICKKNTNVFSEFQDKIQKNARQISQSKEKQSSSSRDLEKQELTKRITNCESKLIEIGEMIKVRQDLTIKNIASQLNMEEMMMKKYVNQQITQLKTRIDKVNDEKVEVLQKISKIQRDLYDRKIEDCFKRDIKKSMESIVIEQREVITIREGEIIKDRTNRFVNQMAISRKEQRDHSSFPLQKRQSGNECKNELSIQQSLYYIDPFGYLLDENRFYLLNSKNQQILLPQRMLTCLKDNNMLVGSGLRSIRNTII